MDANIKSPELMWIRVLWLQRDDLSVTCLPGVAVDDVKVNAESNDKSTAINDKLGRCRQRKHHRSDYQ